MTEDMAGWDCSTMGNLTCGAGAVLPDGTVVQHTTYYGLPDTAMVPTDGGLTFVGVLVLLVGAALAGRRAAAHG